MVSANLDIIYDTFKDMVKGSYEASLLMDSDHAHYAFLPSYTELGGVPMIDLSQCIELRDVYTIDKMNASLSPEARFQILGDLYFNTYNSNLVDTVLQYTSFETRYEIEGFLRGDTPFTMTNYGQYMNTFCMASAGHESFSEVLVEFYEPLRASSHFNFPYSS